MYPCFFQCSSSSLFCPCSQALVSRSSVRLETQNLRYPRSSGTQIYEMLIVASCYWFFAISSTRISPSQLISWSVQLPVQLTLIDIKDYRKSNYIKFSKEKDGIHLSDLAFPWRIGKTSLQGISLTSP